MRVIDTLDISDIILSPVYLLIIYFIAKSYQQKRIKNNPEYKYFVSGLFAKIFGGIGLVFIYYYLYRGGDTINYYMSALGLLKFAATNFTDYLKIMIGYFSNELRYLLISKQPYISYTHDFNSFAVVRFSSIFVFLGGGSFVCSTILVSVFSYFGIWRLFRLFISLFPFRINYLALSIIFMPSVFFWGSGLLKDTYTLFALCVFTYYSFQLFINKKYKLSNIFYIIIASYLMLIIKPYIFLAAFLSFIIMIIYHYYSSFKNKIIRVVIIPAISLVLLLLAPSIMFQLGGLSGNVWYSSIDKVIEKAVVMQQDLKQDYYQGNSFDIGAINPTPMGLLMKAPVAIAAGLFRPYLWDVRNPVMFISALENSLILFMFIYNVVIAIVIVFRAGFRVLVNAIFSHSLIVYSLFFSLIFSYSVGLTTANFGSLVRYKIPAIPLFLASLFVVTYLLNREMKALNKDKNLFIGKGEKLN